MRSALSPEVSAWVSRCISVGSTCSSWPSGPMMCVVELPTIAPIALASPASPCEIPAMPSGMPPSPAAAPEVLE